MEIIGTTNIGLVRDENQDDFYISPKTSCGQYIVVCDGMGGAKAGSVASKLSIQYIKEYIDTGDNDGRDKIELLNSAIEYANQCIYTKSGENVAYRGMGTTVVLGYMVDNEVIIYHVGDSRAYLITDKIEQVTIDHSMVQDMILKGQISEEEAKNHPQKNIITRAIGVLPGVKSDMDLLTMEEGQILLICTDGLSSVVGEEEIFKIIKENTLENSAQKLIKQANDLGGPDNITVVLAKYDKREVR